LLVGGQLLPSDARGLGAIRAVRIIQYVGGRFLSDDGHLPLLGG
jgi:hypothetical protein